MTDDPRIVPLLKIIAGALLGLLCYAMADYSKASDSAGSWIPIAMVFILGGALGISGVFSLLAADRAMTAERSTRTRDQVEQSRKGRL